MPLVIAVEEFGLRSNTRIVGDSRRWLGLVAVALFFDGWLVDGA